MADDQLHVAHESEDEQLQEEGDDYQDEGDTHSIKSEADTTKKKAKKRKKKPASINTSLCKYESVRRVARRLGLKESRDDEEWVLLWSDTTIALERVVELKRFQKINHFPGMAEICRKDLLARNMNRMAKLFPSAYSFTPRSWCLPADYGDFQTFCRQKKNKTYISKPENGCQGKGIFISKNPKDFRPGEHQVVQQYISKPFVIDGFKFDLRIYVLVTQCDPMHIFVYKDGLGRFATQKYTEPTPSNLDDTYMHLTNYAINKLSKDFDRDEETGSKRRLTTVDKWFEDNGYDIKKIWHDIEDVIIKTLIACHPIVKHNYRSCFANHVGSSACFEILGFDVMLDKKLKPWLLEVNHSPSFHTDAPLDKEVKEGFLYDTLNLINLNGDDKRRCQEEDRRKVYDRLFQRQKAVKPKKDQQEETQQQHEEWTKKYEDKHLGGFRRIYPENGNEANYEQYFIDNVSLFTETAASKARQTCAKMLREQIESKQREMEQFKSKLSHSPQKPRDAPLRPESPRITRRPRVPRAMPRVALTNTLKSTSDFAIEKKEENLDSTQPIKICEQEELQRVGELMQRDSLVRGMGLVEYVSQLLRMSPGCHPSHRGQGGIDPDTSSVFNSSALSKRRLQQFCSPISVPYRPAVGSHHPQYKVHSHMTPLHRRDASESLVPLAPLSNLSSSSTYAARVYSGRAYRDNRGHVEQAGVAELPSAATVHHTGSHCYLPRTHSHPINAQTPNLAIIGSSKITLTQRSSRVTMNRGGQAKPLNSPSGNDGIMC